VLVVSWEVYIFFQMAKMKKSCKQHERKENQGKSKKNSLKCLRNEKINLEAEKSV
jgi:hypothetical protein